MYAKIKDDNIEKYPYSESDLKSENPGVSFPDEITAVLSQFGVIVVEPTTAPQETINTKVTEGTPINVDGAWQQTWIVEELTEEEQLQKYQKFADISKQERDELLAKSDWTMLPDSPLNDDERLAWKSYRQQLRDIESLTGYPYQTEFPGVPTVSKKDLETSIAPS